MPPPEPGFSGGQLPFVQASPLWTWDTSGPVPEILGFPPGSVAGGPYQTTKTGLTPGDLQNFVGVPLAYYGNPPQAVRADTVFQWLRWAEDYIEEETGLLLCQTWIAAPPAVVPGSAQSISLKVSGSGGGQQLMGQDFDLYEPGYDFWFDRALDEAWLDYSLRHRPVRSIKYDMTDYNAIKRIAFIYPLLNQFFQVPPNWIVIDEDKGLVRMVPATDVQMLPLFSLQLSFQGFAQSVPAGLWFQYTAGLTTNDYNGRYKNMFQLVLAQAAIMALSAIQGTINLGAIGTNISVDGLAYSTQYPAAGPYAGLISGFTKMRDHLLDNIKSKVAGPVLTFL